MLHLQQLTALQKGNDTIRHVFTVVNIPFSIFTQNIYKGKKYRLVFPLQLWPMC